MLSIVLPLAFLVLGGIGLPGGAVWIDRGRIKGRLRHSLVSAAGPLVNVALAVLLLLLVGRLSVALPGHDVLWAGLAFLAFLEVTATLINLIPMPGLDGFGIIEPWLPRSVVAAVAGIGPFGFLALVALLWIPQVNAAFFGAIYNLIQAAGVEPLFVQLGDTLYRFWLS
jgi:Zn-dependent protease